MPAQLHKRAFRNGHRRIRPYPPITLVITCPPLLIVSFHT